MRTPFSNMVGEMASGCDLPVSRVSQTDYAGWQRQWLFDAIQGMRLGQSFCLYFGVSNASVLYHFRDNETSTRWIKDNYLDKSR